MKPKTRIKVALFAYLLVALVIVLGNSFLKNFGFHTEYTISRYIGLSTWSAILFGISSLFIFWQVLKYIIFIGKTKKMNKLWWIISIITVSALISVGLCPVGYFDQTFGDFGTVSIIHRLSAFIMFCGSIPMILLTALKFKETKSLLIPSIIYIIYSLAFVICYSLNVEIFFNSILFSEAVFLTNFYIIMLLIPISEEKGKTDTSTSENLDK